MSARREEFNALPNTFDQRVIEEFRANAGRVGGPFEGSRLILLTTTGARTGTAHTTPMTYLPDGGERILVIASASGAAKHPAWFHNLVAHRRVTVEDGVFTYEAEAEVLDEPERAAAYARAAEADPEWGVYEAKTDRVIPVVALRQVAGGPPAGVSPGTALRMVHDAFRHELELIREEVAAGGTRLGAQLRVNCLTLCEGLHFHHGAEDNGMFPYFAEHRPDLAPVLARLAEEHERIAVLLEDLRRAVSATGAEPAAVRAEVDRLTGELEAHLAYEEEQLIPVLDG